MLSLIQQEFNISCQEIFGQKSPQAHNSNLTLTDITPVQEDVLDGSGSLMGNPLELHAVANLSLEAEVLVANNCDEEFTAAQSKLLNLTDCVPYDKKNLPDEYKEGYLYYVTLNQQPELFGIFPLSTTSRRIMRIESVPNPDLTANIKQVAMEQMLCSQDYHINFEAVYNLNFTRVTVSFDSCEPRVLSPPCRASSVHLKTELQPYAPNSKSLWPVMLEDIGRLSCIYQAYEADVSRWTMPHRTFDMDAFKNKLVEQMKSESNKPCELPCGATNGGWRIAFAQRNLDSTEVIWENIKGVSHRQEFRTCLNYAVNYLLGRQDLLKLSRYNETQLAFRLRELSTSCNHKEDSEMSSCDTSTGIPPFGPEYLIEIGLNKLTNDCLALLQTVLPEASKLPFMNVKALNNLEHRWSVLHHLYKATCLFIALSGISSKQAYLPQLQKMIHEPMVKGEWRAVLAANDPSAHAHLQLNHAFNINLSELTISLFSNSPSLWMIRLNAERPRRISARVIYELVNHRGKEKYVCHKVRLVDTYWLLK